MSERVLSIKERARFRARAYSLLPPNMPPSPPSTSPALSAMPPTIPALPATTESTCPAMGAGRRSFRKPTTVSTAVRACDSLMPVFSTTCLISSSMICSYRVVDELRRPARDASDEDDGLEVRYVEASAAARILADEHVVNAHHVVTRLCELRLLLLVHAARRLPLLRAPKPAHLVVGALPAVRARVRGALRFGFLVEEISLVHMNRGRRSGVGG